MQALAKRHSCEKVFKATKAMACLSRRHGSITVSRYAVMFAFGSALVACSSADPQQEPVQISTLETTRPAVPQPMAAPAADVSDDAEKLLMAEPEPFENEPKIADAGVINAHESFSATQRRENEAGATKRIAAGIDETVKVAIVPINYAGSWTAINSSGSSCRATLSMAKAGNARRASTSGCAGDDMSRVSAWDLRDDTIVLFGSGSAPVAQFEAAPRAMNGNLTNSGDSVTMSR